VGRVFFNGYRIAGLSRATIRVESTKRNRNLALAGPCRLSVRTYSRCYIAQFRRIRRCQTGVDEELNIGVAA
jgi:hypothetical protein